MSHTVSNLVNMKIERSSTMTNSTLRVWGSVTWRNRRQAPAPSTLAASYSSGAIVCSRAR